MNPLFAWLRGLLPHTHLAGEWETVYAGTCIDLQAQRCVYCDSVMGHRDVIAEDKPARKFMDDPTTEAESWKVRKL